MNGPRPRVLRFPARSVQTAGTRLRRLRLAIACALALAVAGGPGCSGGDEVPIAEGPERFARRYIPRDPAWSLESELPREAQRTPKMVIWEVSAFPPDSEPTPEQHERAEALIERCARVAHEKGWFDFQQGLADGFRLMANDRRHYYNQEFLFDDAVLDCERPEFLMYYGTPRGKQLVGMMFYADEALARGPQVGGPLTVWHFHVWNHPNCMARGLLAIGAADAAGRCNSGTPSHRSPEMVHVWFLEHPEGRFATGMWIKPELVRRAMETRGVR